VYAMELELLHTKEVESNTLSYPALHLHEGAPLLLSDEAKLAAEGSFVRRRTLAEEEVHAFPDSRHCMITTEYAMLLLLLLL
jgi:hypothetical protein